MHIGLITMFLKKTYLIKRQPTQPTPPTHPSSDSSIFSFKVLKKIWSTCKTNTNAYDSNVN